MPAELIKMDDDYPARLRCEADKKPFFSVQDGKEHFCGATRVKDPGDPDYSVVAVVCTCGFGKDGPLFASGDLAVKAARLTWKTSGGSGSNRRSRKCWLASEKRPAPGSSRRRESRR